MQFSRSRRKSGLGGILSTLRRMLVLGVLIFVALKANAPKRLLELYQTWVGTSGQPAGGGATSAGETPSVDAASGDQTEHAASRTGGASVATLSDSETVDVPDAQGLVLMDGTDTSDLDPGDAGAVQSTAGTAGTAASPGETELPALDLDAGTPGTSPGDTDELIAAHQDVAEFLQSIPGDSAAESDAPGSVPAGASTEDPLETMMKEGDAIPGDGTAECPEAFPIKGNGRSGLYHMPEGFAYPRTKADVCFRTPEAAEMAGFRRATG